MIVPRVDTSSKLSCILFLICRIYLPDLCSVVICQKMTDIFCTFNKRSLIKRLKRIGPKTKPCGTPNFAESSGE